MRILLQVNGFLPSIGGKQLVVHHLAEQFTRLGHQVVVAGPSGWRKHHGLDFGYPVRRRPMLPLLPNVASRYVWMTLTRLFGRFDVIHAHITYPCGYVAARTRALSSVPLIITPHGYDISMVPEIGFGMRLDPKLDRRVRYAVGHAQALTAISDTVRNDLLDAGAAPERIVRIPNGVDLARFSRPGPVDMRARLEFPPDCFLVASVGNFHRRKGHHVIVDAMEQLAATRPAIRAVIVGTTSPDLVASVKARGLSDRVKFLGTLPVPMPGQSGGADLLSALLQQAQVYVSAAIDEGAEGLSLALLEGMAAGCAPVATRISGNRDIIEDGCNGLLVRPDSAADLAGALTRLADQPGLLEACREQARQTVAAYGWPAIAEQYLALYTGLRTNPAGR